MPQDAKKGCGHYGLTYVETSELALRRRRCGKGFTYLDGSGNTVRDNALKVRIRQIAIPPAWTDVCIAADDRAHIQAIGRDAEGRLQYLRLGEVPRHHQRAEAASIGFRASACSGRGEEGARGTRSYADQSHRCRRETH